MEDHTVAADGRAAGGGRGQSRGRAPEKQAVHISQRPLWHTTIDWLCRAERVDRLLEERRRLEKSSPKSAYESNANFFAFRNRDRQRVCEAVS